MPGARDSAPAVFAGEWMDGSHGGSGPVAIVALGDRLAVWAPDGAELQSWPLVDLRVERLTGGALHLTHPLAPGALLSASDPGLLDVLVADGAASAPPQPRTLLAQGAAYAAAVGAGVGLFLLMLPALSSSIARRVPAGLEEELAFPVHRLLEGRYCRSAQARSALDGLANALRLSGDPQFPGARLEIVDFAMVNALTLPGGSIVVTRALVGEAEDSGELAGVLAHEMEHVARRHVMGQVVRSVILTTGWRLTVGDFAGLMAIDPSTTLEIASRQFSREAEREADDGALRRLRNAHVSTQGLVTFFARIEEQTDAIPEWLSTHPASEMRRKLFAEARTEEDSREALSGAQWKAIRFACDGSAR